MLTVESLKAAYGAAQVLFDVSFTIGEGEVVTLLGRNGMGKTTTILAVMGLLRPTGGTVTFDDGALTGLPPYRIAQAGLGLVPEGRQVFPTLTVEENLVATAAARFGERWTLARVYEFFPRLSERRRNYGHQLSGGEQQMLAIARALMTNPALLLLDEPLEGLAPIVVEELAAAMERMAREDSMAFILVEQHAEIALALTQNAIVLERGRIVYQGASASLLADHAALDRLIGLRLAEV